MSTRMTVVEEVREDGSRVEWVYKGASLFTKRTLPPRGSQPMTKRESRRRALRNKARGRSR